MRGREGKVDVPRLADRLAAVQRLEHGELARALLQDPSDPVEVLGALGGSGRRPAALKGLPGAADGERDILGPGLRDLRERLLAGGSDRLVVVTGARLDELAADEEAVTLLERDDLSGFGRARVVPFGRGRRPAAALFELCHQSIVK